MRPSAADWPSLSPDARLHGEKVRAHVLDLIAQVGGFLPFDRYMEAVLYAPGLGYYSAGATKFGAAGDFVTAPEISPYFGRTLAQPIKTWMHESDTQILELGAGSGALAVQILTELDSQNELPERYSILELSADLRERQKARLSIEVPHLLHRVEWLDALPAQIDGVVLGNEILDAVPVQAWQRSANGVFERGVVAGDGGFHWAQRPASPSLVSSVEAIRERVLRDWGEDWPTVYESESSEAALGLTRSLIQRLKKGVLLWIDYGFPALEYYHPQRSAGTLIAHYRHRAHGDPFHAPGLEDLTAHVNFSAHAEVARTMNSSCLGYTSQAAFLLECGLLDLMSSLNAEDLVQYSRAAAGVQKLLAEQEMGELFKVIAFAKGGGFTPIGFRRDRQHRL